MGQGNKFKQQWEFRRRHSHFDSSSSEPESSSSGEPVLKKHRLLSEWMSPRISEGGDATRSRSKGRRVSSKGGHFKAKKASKMQIRLNRKEDDPVYTEMVNERSAYEVNNSKSSAYDPSSLNSTRILMESILEELKVARENMFIWMREEMRKVMDDDTALGTTAREGSCAREIVDVQHKNSFKSGSDVQNCSTRSSAGSIKHKRILDSINCYKAAEDQADYCQTTGPIFSTETERGEGLGSSVKGSTFSGSPSNQVSSMYLTLPSVLPEAYVENQRFDSSSCNFFQNREFGDRAAVSIGKEIPLLDSSIHHGVSSGLQQEENFGNIAHIGSQDMGYVGQNKLTLASSFGSGFPIPFHHGLDGAFKIQTQASSLQNLSQVQNNILDLSMNGGGMRLIGGSLGLSEHVTSSLSNHLNSKVNEDVWSRDNSIPGSQRGLVMHELVYH